MKIALVLCLGLATLALGQRSKSITVGLQAGGTLSWVTYAMQQYGLPRDLGFDLKAISFASKDATRLALRANEIQLVVDDFVEVQALRTQGFPVEAVYPYSLNVGGVVVPSNSSIRSGADLRGRVIGVTSLTDKTFILLRAYSLRKHGFDPLRQSQVIATGSPLMAELLERGQLEAALPFWHHVARMEATGKYREVISSQTMLGELGLPKDVPQLFIIVRQDADPKAVELFLRALLLTVERMRKDDRIWFGILEQRLYVLPDTSQLSSIRARWERGLPQRWDAGVLVAMRLLVERLIAVAGSDVVGIGGFDPRAFSLRYSQLTTGR